MSIISDTKPHFVVVQVREAPHRDEILLTYSPTGEFERVCMERLDTSAMERLNTSAHALPYLYCGRECRRAGSIFKSAHHYDQVRCTLTLYSTPNTILADAVPEITGQKGAYTQPFESPEAAEAFLMMMPLDIYSARRGGRVMW